MSYDLQLFLLLLVFMAKNVRIAPKNYKPFFSEAFDPFDGLK